MPPLPPDLIARPPEEAARLIALQYLDHAVAARARVDNPEDKSALHDFRVALRRLRSCLSAYRPYLGKAAAKKIRRRLRDLAGATGAGRDAEVQGEWLLGWRDGLTTYRRVGCDWLLARVTARRRTAAADVRRAAGAEFEKLERRLRPRLREYVHAVPGYESEPLRALGDVVSALAREQAQVLAAELGQVLNVADEAKAHRARIEAKRLRYLLEPVAALVDGGSALVSRLKALQHTLGEWHDLDLLAEEVAGGLEVAAAQRARRLHDAALAPATDERAVRRAARAHERPGLLALAHLVREKRDAVFATFAAEWLPSGGEGFLAQVQVVADHLAARHSGIEIERKYLLRGAPDAVRGVVAIDIEQGWLPGRRLQERVRRSLGPDGERYFRTVKSGAGVQRLELEEEIGQKDFLGLWPLTEGRRLRKRRYVLPTGELAWEIDEFLDRNLWLAEIELPRADAAVELPPWLAGQVVREVTGEPEFLNYNLAS
jgi:CHAD domain-containing protein/CYTH domain-containing protein